MTTLKQKNSPAIDAGRRKTNPVFAIGHSTRPLNEFIQTLRAHGATLLADIRTIPKSGHNPQFNGSVLKKLLPKLGIKYRWLKNLGGLRRASANSHNAGWRNLSFRGFADYMQTKEFSAAIRNLIALSKKERVAIMCAEGNPFRCHRSLVADALTARGTPVLHIAGKNPGREHKMTPFAEIKKGKVFYP